MNINKFLSRKIGKIIPNITSNWVTEPVFMIGCARSGTTMIADILGQHRDIAHYSEANDIWDPNGYPWYESDLQRPPNWIDPYKFNEIWWKDTKDRYIEIKGVFGFFQKLSRKKMFLNKTPMNTFKIPYILEMFPTAKFINVIRDGRAVTLSYFKKTNKKMVEHSKIYKSKNFYFNKDDLLDKLAQSWVEHIKEVELQSKKLNIQNRIFEISYENFCNDPKKSISSIYDFLNLDLKKSGIVNFPKTKNMNYKYKNELSLKQIDRITDIMRKTLIKKKYIKK